MSKTPDEESPTTEQQPENQEPEDDEECGLCLYMKGGACKQVFIDWQKYCMEEGEKNKEDVEEKCFQATSALMKCMQANSDYYKLIMRAEKATELEAVKQLNKEREKEKL